MLARGSIALALAAVGMLPAAAHAAFTPLNALEGAPKKGTFTCAANQRSGTFKVSGPTTEGLVGAFEAQGSATFGPPDQNGFGAVTSFKMTFEVQGRAGQVLNAVMTGGGYENEFESQGGCGEDVGFGSEFVIFGVKDATWSADVKTRFGTYHDHGDGNVNDLHVFGNGTADGTAPNAVSAQPGKPTNVIRPRLTGNPDVGGVLKCTNGLADWIGAAAGISKWEWLRDGAPVATHNGALGKTTDAYTVQPADAMRRLACRTTTDRGFGLDSASALSNGAVGNGCLVPNVHGKGLAKAKSALAAENCAVGQITRRKGKGVPVGHVLAQHPAAGAAGPKGMKVALVLRKKPS